MSERRAHGGHGEDAPGTVGVAMLFSAASGSLRNRWNKERSVYSLRSAGVRILDLALKWRLEVLSESSPLLFSQAPKFSN